MAPPPPPTRPKFSKSTSPLLTLTTLFLVHRLILTLLIHFTPSSYDSSASILLPPATSVLQRFLQKLTSWDAIYFISIARRGYIYEQEWAFGWGFTRVLGWIGRVVLGAGRGDAEGYAYVLAGIILSNLMHYLSILVLYALSREVLPGKGRRWAVGVALLHLLCPAGVFLFAPAPEALFSFLTFAGSFAFVRTRRSGSALAAVGWTLVMGALWGVSCTVRSNGILNGVVVFVEFVRIGTLGMQNMGMLARWLALGAAGVMVGAGFVGPQVLAWQEYCASGTPREWCSKALPSIYTFVQEHYWNVGFLRYWTPGNIPLFLLAAPMLTLLILSSKWALATQHSTIGILAIPQALLALMAFTNFHVQIILRLSSGCIVWYWYVAEGLGRGERWADRCVWWMVGYAAVQAVLYAAFLPPA